MIVTLGRTNGIVIALGSGELAGCKVALGAGKGRKEGEGSGNAVGAAGNGDIKGEGNVGACCCVEAVESNGCGA